MISLKPNQVNKAIFTLTENEIDESTGAYHMSLTNCLSLKTISDIVINDVSLHPERFNQSNIVLANLLTELNITENTTLESDSFYFVDGDITVATGITLSIPYDTYIIQNSTKSIVNNGTIVRNSHIITTVSLVTNKNWIYLDSSTVNPQEITFLFDFLSGTYDYIVESEDDSETLEIGKLMINEVLPVINEVIYTKTDNTYVYNG